MRKIERSKVLAEKVFDVLCENISKMEIGDNRLPSEEELSKTLGVSRATVREALKNLKVHGFITTIHGVGTFGHPSALNIQNRLDLSTDFMAFLEAVYEPEDIDLRIKHLGFDKASKACQKHLEVDEIDVHRMDWIFLAQKKPMMYCKYEMKKDAFRTEVDPNLKGIEDLGTFSRAFLHDQIAYCSMELGSSITKEVAEYFQVDLETPILYWEETIYNINDAPVGYAICYAHPDNMKMSVLTHFN